MSSLIKAYGRSSSRMICPRPVIQVKVVITTLLSPSPLAHICSADPFDLCHYVEKDTLPELHDALENTASVTRALVTTLIESGGARNILASESGYVHKLQKSQSEVRQQIFVH